MHFLMRINRNNNNNGFAGIYLLVNIGLYTPMGVGDFKGLKFDQKTAYTSGVADIAAP